MTVTTEEQLLHDRQRGVLAEIEQAGGRELADRTDELIGELLGQIQTEAVAEVLGGRVIEGVVITGDGCRFGPPIELPIPRFTPPNPPFDECRCKVAAYHRGKDDEAEARQIHDLLLSLEGANPLDAMSEVIREILEGGLFNGPGGFLHGETFEPFFGEHRWGDQAGAHDLGIMLDMMWKTNEFSQLIHALEYGDKPISDIVRHPRHGERISRLRSALVKS